MNRKLIALLAVTIFVAGCATTGGNRNYQPEIDKLNAQLSDMQGKLSAKDRELQNLMSQNRTLQADLNAANSSLADTKGRLNQALGQLAGQQAGKTTSSTTKQSYIK
jgi:peptidoglycan hydrolase CwlO-like protein